MDEEGSWDGPKLADLADPDDIDFDKIVDVDADDEEDEDSSEEFDVQLSPSDERLLEELLRLKLTSLPASAAPKSSHLPLSKSVGLFQPRSKLEQFEDILFESQLLEAGFPELEVAAATAVASNGTFESVGFDFDASDAIYNEDIDNEANEEDNNCDCNTCKERMRHKEELQRLKETWSEVRGVVQDTYGTMLVESEHKNTLEKYDVCQLKDKVRQLLWRDPHQLYQRLESIVKDCVIEQKVKLIKLLKSQAKNPSLAQDFIQRLLDGYERLCNACIHLGPSLIELENEHLSRFSLTWEVLNKYLHQSIIYSDPIIQTNVPIFISQLRSLYSDKEHEGKYTELVRGFLDFDVEMSNIVPLWSNSEKLLNEYNKQQAQLRAKQKMLKEDWERFKAQRRDLKIQMDQEECSSSLIEGIKKCPNFGSDCNCDFCKSFEDDNQSQALNGNQGTLACSQSGSKLADVFPSLLTAEGKKETVPNPPPRTTDDSPLCESVEDLAAEVQECMNIYDNKERPPPPPPKNRPPPPSNNAKGPPPPPPAKKATTAKELRDLMYQHYCVGKGKLKKPSANAIKKGKVPPPACSTIKNKELPKGPDDSTDEMSDNDEEDSDDTGSETSKATTTTASESHNKNGVHCNCCYCEVFGPGGQSVAPVSRNYPEMRERLRLLLSKKKRKGQQCTQQHPPPPPPPKKQEQLQTRASSASSSASSNLRSSRSEKSKESPAPSTAPPLPIQTTVKDEKALDELLEFIEGNQRSGNDKKRAKKERQKQQKIQEIRKKEEEERKKREAEEAERKRREEEIRRAAEEARKLEKKKKKKTAQKLKKLAAKGELPPAEEMDTTNGKTNAVNPENALEELRAKHLRELQELQLAHQRQLEEEAKRLKLKSQPVIPVMTNDTNRTDSNAKAGTQIKIKRTPTGGVEFTTVPVGFNASTASTAPGPSYPNMNTGMPPTPEQPATSRPSVPSKTGAPMVTIRRIETPGVAEPMVTISMAKEGKQKEDKLLYTLVNGQAMKTQDAPSDLLPHAKPVDNLSKKQRKKLKRMERQEGSGTPQGITTYPKPTLVDPTSLPPGSMFGVPSAMPVGPFPRMAAPQPPPAQSMQTPQPRAPLPLDSHGKVDLNRLDLPPGISITRINGPTPDRKYFPASASEYSGRDQSVLPMPGTLEPQTNNSTGVDYSAMDGMPAGLSGPNVIVVDTSSLKTREEEEKEKKGKKNKKKNKKNEASNGDVLAKSASVGVMPSYMTPMAAPTPQAPSPSSVPSGNSLKSGPQVLIKNVNGKVTITPVPGTGATPIDSDGLPNASSKKQPPQVNGKKPPQLRQVVDVQKSHSVPNVNGHMHHSLKNGGGDSQKLHDESKKFSFAGADGDDPDKVFAPSNDIDMDKADDSDRVVEQYKRFLAGFPSPSPDQPRVRPKVELDLKNIFKKKPATFGSNGNMSSSEATSNN